MSDEFDVTLDVYFRQRNKSYIVLASQDELDEADREIAASEEEVKELLESEYEEEKLRGRAQLLTTRQMRRNLAAERKNREDFLSKSEQREYTLIKPGLGDYLKAESAATTTDYTGGGTTHTDQAKMLEKLLPKAVKGMEPADVLKLPPNISRKLWEILWESLFPDSRRLPFLS